MITHHYLFVRPALAGGLLALVFTGGLVAADDLPTLDGMSLFMSHAERDEIDNRSPVAALEPETAVDEQPAQPAGNLLIERKVSLNGVVIRPDHSTVLLLNTASKVLTGDRKSTSRDFRFEVEVYRQSLRLSPGETVRVAVGDDQ